MRNVPKFQRQAFVVAADVRISGARLYSQVKPFFAIKLTEPADADIGGYHCTEIGVHL